MKPSDDDREPQNRELYALLHISPDASDEEIRKAYRQWAQVYHPDKYQSPQMKEVATHNFQRICEAYEILTDENKRQIYDIYGMEGLRSGLELGPKLSKADEIREEIERLMRLKKEEKVAANFRTSGTILANLSLPDFLDGESLVKGMAMSSEIQSQLSKSNALAFGGNMIVKGNVGGGGTTAVFKHQLSPSSSIEFIGAVGLQSLLEVRASRQLTAHSTATMGLAMSLQDGSINLTNIQLLLGEDPSISVGWQKKDAKISVAGEVKLGISSFGASGHYTRRFSSKSHGRIAGKVGRYLLTMERQTRGHRIQSHVMPNNLKSSALEIEIGGGRKISEFSTVCMLYTVGIQGIFWKFELHRGGQKLIVPILLSSTLSPMFATGAFVIPASLYFLLKNYVAKPYLLKREKKEALENMERTASQVKEARAAAQKAQQLLENVANRKRKKQSETDGLVITRALYGNSKALKSDGGMKDIKDDVASQVLDVTIPLNFLVSDSGELKLHEGIKKSGIMGFCDPCPGEPKSLHVEYTYAGNNYKVDVDDYAALHLPSEDHRI